MGFSIESDFQDLTADVNFVDLQLWGDSFGLTSSTI